jgi:hypothetical protein
VGLNLPSSLLFIYLFIYLLVWTLLPTHFRCTGLLLLLITHTHTHFVWFLWTRDWPITETLTWTTQHSQETDIHAPSRILTHNPNKWVATRPHFRLPKHLDQPEIKLRNSVVYTVVPYCIQFYFILFSCFTVLVWDQPGETAETTSGDYKL